MCAASGKSIRMNRRFITTYIIFSTSLLGGMLLYLYWPCRLGLKWVYLTMTGVKLPIHHESCMFRASSRQLSQYIPVVAFYKLMKHQFNIGSISMGLMIFKWDLIRMTG